MYTYFINFLVEAIYMPGFKMQSFNEVATSLVECFKQK